ncbi:uncharacterized protein LOC129596393 [Paramacrobiotus metropolitanus]|uniref:uncharacterized protein LOC129596393 n=1 Tax=Paramacrobiotus metropolitanus TaxID=2943436 RepID=UPI00244656DF|nr:uncharacterized protein LOC129596393 [Paramacrobiotus metropolitanus]
MDNSWPFVEYFFVSMFITTVFQVAPSSPANAIATNSTEGSFANVTDASFDISPLRVRECEARPHGICSARSLRSSDCRFHLSDSKDYQTHVTLHCEWTSMKNITKDIFKKQTVAISTRSKNRAVSVEILNDTVLDPEVIGPIRDQVAVLKIQGSRDNNITSRVGLLRMTRLLHILLERCQPLIIRQPDFSPMQNLRMILFYATAIQSVQPETFVDLPQLQVFGVASTDYLSLDDDKLTLFENLNKFYCDPGNEWLWKWLATYPQLSVNRKAGRCCTTRRLFPQCQIRML